MGASPIEVLALSIFSIQMFVNFHFVANSEERRAMFGQSRGCDTFISGVF
jgi:hypothetical protein